jgi:hypothetical protein
MQSVILNDFSLPHSTSFQLNRYFTAIRNRARRLITDCRETFYLSSANQIKFNAKIKPSSEKARIYHYSRFGDAFIRHRLAAFEIRF